MLKNLVVLGGLLSIAQAGPCKPLSLTTSNSLSLVITTAIDTTTTAVVDTTTTEGLEITSTEAVKTTTATDFTTTTTAASSIATAVDTTTTTADETTITAASTTTTAIDATTTTADQTTTTNASSVPPKPTSCAIDPHCPASGWNVDYYSNVFEEGYGNDEISVPASYYITEGLSPLDSSLTDETYFAQDFMSDLVSYPQIFPNNNYPGKAYYVGYQRTLNGGITVDANSFTLVYQGYYQAPATGAYELCIQADNANTLYFGEGNAFTCGTGEPSVDAPALVLTATGYHFNNPVRCGSVALIKGHNYPVRNVMGNKNAVSMFEFTIKAPGDVATHSFTGKAYPVECGLGI